MGLRTTEFDRRRGIERSSD